MITGMYKRWLRRQEQKQAQIAAANRTNELLREMQKRMEISRKAMANVSMDLSHCLSSNVSVKASK